MEIFRTHQAWNFLGRNIFCHHDLTCLICTVGSICILHQDKFHRIDRNFLSIPVVWVFLVKDIGSRNPLFHSQSAVSYICFRVDCPLIAVCLNDVFLYRA